MLPPSSFTVRPAIAADVPQIAAFIRELAEYERLADACVLTEARLLESLFGPRPFAEVLIAEAPAAAGAIPAPLGFALFFHNYSTFLAQPGIYLEDLFVRPAHRGRGVGKALLARIAQLAVERNCGRVEWAVLHWNTPAIGFYQKLGAIPQNEWTVYRLTGPALQHLGAAAD